MLVIFPDQCDFEFSIKAAEWKCRTEDSTHIQEIEIIDNPKVPKSFQCYLGNSNRKSNLVKNLFLNGENASSETIYLANLDGTTDRVTSQSSERIHLYCDHGDTDIKMFAYVKLLCDNIPLNMVIIISPGSDVAVIKVLIILHS